MDERLGLSRLAYPVPANANSLPYVFGFLILTATEVLLAQFYHTHPANAHDSVIYIISQIPFGDFIRSVHFWTVTLVIGYLAKGNDGRHLGTAHEGAGPVTVYLASA